MTTYTVAPSALIMTNARARRGSWNTTQNIVVSDKQNNMIWNEFAKEQPEQGQKVIAAERLGKGEYQYFIATYKMGNFFTYTQAVSTGSNGKIKVVIEGRLEGVTHWMPAPEAPTEE